jgi:hypothetical protein
MAAGRVGRALMRRLPPHRPAARLLARHPTHVVRLSRRAVARLPARDDPARRPHVTAGALKRKAPLVGRCASTGQIGHADDSSIQPVVRSGCARYLPHIQYRERERTGIRQTEGDARPCCLPGARSLTWRRPSTTFTPESPNRYSPTHAGSAAAGRGRARAAGEAGRLAGRGGAVRRRCSAECCAIAGRAVPGGQQRQAGG